MAEQIGVGACPPAHLPAGAGVSSGRGVWERDTGGYGSGTRSVTRLGSAPV